MSFELWYGNLSIKNPQEFWKKSTDVSPNGNMSLFFFLCRPVLTSDIEFLLTYLVSYLKKGNENYSLDIALLGTNCLNF